MAGFENVKGELDSLGAQVFAASVDPLDRAREIAANLTFPVGYGMTHADAHSIGAFWEERRSIVQPANFIVGQNGRVLASSYAAGAIGRMEPADVVSLLKAFEKPKT